MALLLTLCITPSFAGYEENEAVVEADSVGVLNPIEVILNDEAAIAYYEIPDDILENLAKNPGSLKRPGTTTQKSQGTGAVHKQYGYRIQVFSDGRNPSTLQSRAKARGSAIVARFPKYRGQVYSFSSSPNWYTRIGNFKTQKEAADAMAELKRAFPSFAGEMRVVKSPITIIR